MSLILRLRDGKDDDWRRFHGIYGPIVFQLAVQSGLRAGDAEDVVSEVMHVLFGGFRKGAIEIDPAKGRFRSYLATIVRREIGHSRRRKVKGVSGTELSENAVNPEAMPEQQLANLERLERLRLCLDRLRVESSFRQRDLKAFEEYALQEMSAKAVATKYGVTVGRLYAIKSKILDRIRTMMAQLDVELGEV